MGGERIGDMLSKLAGFSFFLGTIKQLLPGKLLDYVDKFCSNFFSMFHPYIEIKFDEYNTSGKQNNAYSYIKTFLGTKSNNQSAKFLKAEKFNKSKSVVISLDEGESIIDEFEGIFLKWEAFSEKIQDLSSRRIRYNGVDGPLVLEKRSYVLTFHKKDRDVVTKMYLDYVVEKGKEIEYQSKKRKLYTNKCSDDWWYGGKWSGIRFEHPATFSTIALDPKKKQDIINDLGAFRKGKDYYASIGKAWKRGYLLYGPPGTGKSTMICAIANFLEYDIYDLELTSVYDNAELKQLLIDIKGKSIIVIEDIDCSVDLTGKRKKKKKKTDDDDDTDDSEDEEGKKKSKKDKVTLSGLLNVIDGIWSACGQERIIIFTTNHVDKLDPALIRRGRMDLHIEMSYCRFEAFKVLAKNYLGIDTHPLFEEIKDLLEKTNVSPCDAAENLMPKTDPKDVDACLKTLIQTCMAAKQVQQSILDDEHEEEPGKTKFPERILTKLKKKLKGKKLLKLS